MTVSTENDLLAYRSFWEANLQKVEEIASHLEKKLLALERKQKTEMERYQELERLLDFLLSIYSSYNCFKGREYLLKLKACLSKYSDQTRNESVRFDILHYLLAKAKEHTSRGFDEFPRMKHEYRCELSQNNKAAKTPVLPFRWIAFRSAARWFIAPYNELHIIGITEAMIREDSGKAYLAFGGKKIPINNYPPVHQRSTDEIRCYLIITEGGSTTCYAASETGRKISASRDVITPRLKVYSLAQKKYIRLFGRNHIFIDV